MRRDSTINANRIKPRGVYIFAIDSWGKGTPLWSADNTVPYDSAGVKSAPVAIAMKPNLLSVPYIPIGAPYGTDTFVMISSSQQLDPELFRFESVRTRGGGADRGSGGPALQQLLSGLGGRTRGTPVPVPVNWSIQRVALKSVDPKATP